MRVITVLEAYRKHVAERAAQGIVPQPLNAEQTAGLVELLKNPPAGEEEFLLDLITNRVPPGVDEAAYVKAGFLSAVAKGEATSPLISKQRAVELLGTMQGGYNIATLVELLDDATLGAVAAEQLKHTLLMFDAFHDVAEKAKAGNANAKAVLQSWADGEWFTAKPAIAEKYSLAVFKVPGETNTDDLSPAPDAWSRPDIPLHALAMLKMARDGIVPDQQGVIGPLKQIEEIKAKGFPVAYVGDVVGTGSSRKSATNSVLWFFGNDIPYVPNKRAGGFCFGTKIAPIFYNTMEDAGALPIEFDCTNLAMGDVIDVYPFAGKVCKHGTDDVWEHGVIPLSVIQKYLNFQFSVSMDLFGSEQSTNAGNYYTSGLKGRWQETRRKDDHTLLDGEREMSYVEDGEIRTKTVPMISALNLDLRDEYVADCANGVNRWNQALEDAGLEERLYLPHEGFHRLVGVYAGHHVSPEGEVLDDATWEARKDEWIPSAQDRAKVAELMVPEYELGKFASWIAEPPTGINGQPVEYDYVHLYEEGLREEGLS